MIYVNMPCLGLKSQNVISKYTTEYKIPILPILWASVNISTAIHFHDGIRKQTQHRCCIQSVQSWQAHRCIQVR